MAYLGRPGATAPLTSADIPDNSITGAKIVEGTVAVGDIGTDAVGADELANNAVDTNAIADDAVTGAKIENNPTIAGNLTVSGNTTLTGDLVPSTPLSNRNMIINGGMNVAQRGTSSAGMDKGNSGYYTCDRFATRLTTSLDNIAFTNSQNSITDNEGFRKTFKILITTAESAVDVDEYFLVDYRVEAQDLCQLWYGNASAKNATLSFYVRSNETGNFALEIYAPDGDRCIGTTYTVSNTNWQRVTWTIPGDTAGTINNDNGAGFFIRWWLLAGTNYTSAGSNATWAGSTTTNSAVGHTASLGDAVNNYWEITGVQLELGSNATPFEHRSFGEELQRCDRYYQKSFQYTTVPVHGVDGLYGSTTPYHTAICKLICHLSNPMRTVPDFTFYSSDSGGSGSQVHSHDGSWTNTDASASGQSDRAFVLNFNHTGANTDETVLVNFNYEAVAEL